MRRLLFSLSFWLLLVGSGAVHAQVQLLDESDRAAFRSWFTFLADAQFYRQTDDVIDCAALVRHAYREALRAHTPEWTRLARLPLSPAFPDIRRRPRAEGGGWRLFKTGDGTPAQYAEFVDARTLVRYSARFISRDPRAARPGDLLVFHQPEQRQPDHLMVFVGRSVFERGANDWIVYHTGASDSSAGEVRKVRLSDLLHHPSPHWRPQVANENFRGVYRLTIL